MQQNIFAEEWAKWDMDNHNDPFKTQAETIRTDHENVSSQAMLKHLQTTAENVQKEQQYNLELARLDIASKILIERHKGTPLGDMMIDLMTKSEAAYDKGFQGAFTGKGKKEDNGVIDVEWE